MRLQDFSGFLRGMRPLESSGCGNPSIPVDCLFHARLSAVTGNTKVSRKASQVLALYPVFKGFF